MLSSILLIRNLVILIMATVGSQKALLKKQIAEDAFKLFAEKLMDHKELESKWGVLKETHLKYFRGKDFVSFMKTHPELMNVLPEANRNSTVEGIANVLLRKDLLVRSNRVVKTFPPGKNLPTWPKHLEIFPSRVFSETDAFFAWTFVKPRPLWQKILLFLWPVLVTLALCLFPQFRHQCKRLVLYSSSGVILLILGLLILIGVMLMLWVSNRDEHDEDARERLREEIINNNESTTETKSKTTTEEEVIRTQPATTKEAVIKNQPATTEEDPLLGHYPIHPLIHARPGM